VALLNYKILEPWTDGFDVGVYLTQRNIPYRIQTVQDAYKVGIENIANRSNEGLVTIYHAKMDPGEALLMKLACNRIVIERIDVNITVAQIADGVRKKYVKTE